MKKLLPILFFVLSISLLNSNVTLADAAIPKAGVDFNSTAQVIPTDNPKKIEVTELFWYGCPHCFHMEEPLTAWVKKLPADVYFKRVPGLPQPAWAPMAKAYYAMESLGVLDKLHTPLFDAIHVKKTLNPTDEKAVINWIANNAGLDRKKVEDAFASFSMNSQLNRAAQFFQATGATGVPSLIIDGRFITSSTMTGSNENALKVADFLINNIRKEKGLALTKK